MSYEKTMHMILLKTANQNVDATATSTYANLYNK
jgi:hypothetical protein